jgi:hypothetical protein
MIHIVFSPSAEGTLRQVLRERGLKDQVIGFSDWLDCGPIADDSFAERAHWLDANAPTEHGGWDWIIEEAVRFRSSVSGVSDPLIWLAPRSAAERCGLHWYLDQFGGDGAEMIIAEHALRGEWYEEPPLGLDRLGMPQMAQLLDECPRLPWNQSRFPPGRWRDLVTENALIRIVQNDILKSAEDSFFDDFILRRCSAIWVITLRVVGYTMGDTWEAGYHASSSMLTWRIRELIRTGVLECDGDLPMDMGAGPVTRIRLAQ